MGFVRLLLLFTLTFLIRAPSAWAIDPFFSCEDDLLIEKMLAEPPMRAQDKRDLFYRIKTHFLIHQANHFSGRYKGRPRLVRSYSDAAWNLYFDIFREPRDSLREFGVTNLKQAIFKLIIESRDSPLAEGWDWLTGQIRAKTFGIRAQIVKRLFFKFVAQVYLREISTTLKSQSSLWFPKDPKQQTLDGLIRSFEDAFHHWKILLDKFYFFYLSDQLTVSPEEKVTLSSDVSVVDYLLRAFNLLEQEGKLAYTHATLTKSHFPVTLRELLQIYYKLDFPDGEPFSPDYVLARLLSRYSTRLGVEDLSPLHLPWPRTFFSSAKTYRETVEQEELPAKSTFELSLDWVEQLSRYLDQIDFSLFEDRKIASWAVSLDRMPVGFREALDKASKATGKPPYQVLKAFVEAIPRWLKSHPTQLTVRLAELSTSRTFDKLMPELIEKVIDAHSHYEAVLRVFYSRNIVNLERKSKFNLFKNCYIQFQEGTVLTGAELLERYREALYKEGQALKSKEHFPPEYSYLSSLNEDVNHSAILKALDWKQRTVAIGFLSHGPLQDNLRIHSFQVARPFDIFGHFYRRAALRARKTEGVLDRKSVEGLSDEEFKELLKTSDIEALLEAFSEEPELALTLIASLKKDQLAGREALPLVVRYQGLTAKQTYNPTVRSCENKNRVFLKALFSYLNTLSPEEVQVRALKELGPLLIRINRKTFEVAPHELYDKLQHFIDELQANPEQTQVRQVLCGLYKTTLEHFQEVDTLKVDSLKTTPFRYQKEAIQFLVSHPNAILALTMGLGKTLAAIAASLKLDFKKVLFITTASNVTTIYDELLDHAEISTSEIGMIPTEKKKRVPYCLNDLQGKRFLLASYDTIRLLEKEDPEAFKKLVEDLDIKIIDEAQVIDNAETQRRTAIAKIKTPKTWLLTATPYQSKIHRLWSLLNLLNPEQFPDEKLFVKQFRLSDPNQLFQLYLVLQEYLFRLTKEEVLSYFEDPKVKPFEEQLKGGMGRIPRRVDLDPALGRWALSMEQSDLIAQMIFDFKGWVMRYNDSLPLGHKKINMDHTGPLQQLHWLEKAIFDPEFFGFTQDPLLEKLDQIVEHHMALGEKLILWGWHQETLKKITKRYERYGTVHLHGSLTREERKERKDKFQEDKDCRILVGNFISGGLGLTLTAAHTAYYVEYPDNFPPYHQTNARNDRAIGEKNIRHAKEKIYLGHMVPYFPPAFIDQLPPKLKAIFEKGTLVEQTLHRIEDGRIKFNLVMGGKFSDDEWDETNIKLAILQNILASDREAYVPIADKFVQKLGNAARVCLPLWKKANAEQKDKLITLSDKLKGEPSLLVGLESVFKEFPDASLHDLDYLLALLEIRNGALRQLLLEHLPTLLRENYQKGHRHPVDFLIHLQKDRLTPSVLVASFFTERGQFSLFQSIAARLDALPTTHSKVLQVHYAVAVLGLNQDWIEKVLMPHQVQIARLPLEQQVEIVYRLGLLAQHGVEMSSLTNISFEELQEVIPREGWNVISGHLSRPPSKIKKLFKETFPDYLLALALGWKKKPEAFENYVFLLTLAVDGKLEAYRKDGVFKAGREINFLKDQPLFWEEVEKNREETRSIPLQDSTAAMKALRRNLNSILGQSAFVAELVGDAAVAEVKRFQEETPTEQRRQYQALTKELEELAKGTNPAHQKRIQEKYGLEIQGDGFEGSLERETQSKLKHLSDLYALAILVNDLRLEEPFFLPIEKLINILTSKAREFEGISEEFSQLLLEASSNLEIIGIPSSTQVTEVRIRETTELQEILRFGLYHPDLRGCTHPNGSPSRTETLLGLLASKNNKVLLIETLNGEVLARAVYKVRQDAQGNPALFIDFVRERKVSNATDLFVNFLAKKLIGIYEKTGIPASVSIFDRNADQTLDGTGFFNEYELVGAQFGLRRQEKVKHRAVRIFTPKP